MREFEDALVLLLLLIGGSALGIAAWPALSKRDRSMGLRLLTVRSRRRPMSSTAVRGALPSNWVSSPASKATCRGSSSRIVCAAASRSPRSHSMSL